MKSKNALKLLMLAIITMLVYSCASTYPNYGTAHDRTGTNGATNGNGKAPRGSAHTFKY